MVAVAAVVVLAAAGGGYWMMTKDGGTEPLSRELGDATPAGTPSVPAASPLPANVVVARAMESLPDALDSAGARQVLALLQPLDSLARLSDDSTLLHFRYERGRAMIGVGEVKAGCDTLRDMEALLSNSRFKRSSNTFLTNVCTP